MKKSLLLAAMFAIVLAGCSKKEETVINPPATEAAPAAPAAEAAPAAPAAEAAPAAPAAEPAK